MKKSGKKVHEKQGEKTLALTVSATRLSISSLCAWGRVLTCGGWVEATSLTSPPPICVAATRTSINQVIRSYIKTMKRPGDEGRRRSEIGWKRRRRDEWMELREERKQQGRSWKVTERQMDGINAERLEETGPPSWKWCECNRNLREAVKETDQAV